MKKFLLLFSLLLCFATVAQRIRPSTDPISPYIDPNDGSNPPDPGTIPIGTNPIISPAGNEVGLTEGQLSVSLSGAATYNIPIAVPPGLVGVMPQIGLSYSSQGGNGSAGYGWGVSGISSISRIPSTMFHDGIIDGVDFDDLDRFALDGQRLVVKSGTTGDYGANGTIYETENFSNVEIISYITRGLGRFNYTSFNVKYPDGSQAGYSGSISYQIDYWENAQGVRISYEYNYLPNNEVSIKSIKYGSPVGTGNTLNEILFIYKIRQRPESGYVGGLLVDNKTILSEIRVKSNNVGFRNYKLTHNVSNLGYERLTQFTEKTGDNSLS